MKIWNMLSNVGRKEPWILKEKYIYILAALDEKKSMKVLIAVIVF